MKVLFRCDASIEIGIGHVMRCLTLADELNRHGVNIVFISRNLPGNLNQLIVSKGYQVFFLDEKSPWSGTLDAEVTLNIIREMDLGPIDWVVVDHYLLDIQWELYIRSSTTRLMVIDDLANRKHDCDLLLDQNYYVKAETRYRDLVPDHAVCLLGPKYALLKPEYYELSKTTKIRDGQVKNLLIFMGGSDPTNQTYLALMAVEKLDRKDLQVNVVVGDANPRKDEIRAFCEGKKWASYYCQISNMAELIAYADLAIGAGGATTWERCILGLPTMTVVIADNQLKTTCDLDAEGVLYYMGLEKDQTIDSYKKFLQELIEKPDKLVEMSRRSLDLIKAHGSLISRYILSSKN